MPTSHPAAPPARAAGAPAHPQLPHDRCSFGEFTIDLARGRLMRGDTVVPLRPKAYALLAYLVAHAGRLVGKDELLAAIWPAVVVTEDSLTRCVSELRAALGDGEQRLIQNVPRRGYLFDADVVSAAAAAPDPAALGLAFPAVPIPGAGTAVHRQRSRRAWILGLGLLALAVVVAAGLWQARPRAPAPARLSLVVLPFIALGGEADAAPIAAALTEDLTGALARLQGVRVVSAGGAAAWRGSPLDARRVGGDLDVRYAVEGSVQSVAGGLRVNARLIDVRSGAALWSDRDEAGGTGRPGRQDEIVLRLATALDAELVRAHAERIAATDPRQLDAEDLALQCVAASWAQGGESPGPAYALCEQALQKDPANPRALARLAWYHADRVSRQQSVGVAADLQQAERYVARALKADDRYYAAHCAKAAVLEGQGRLPEAVVAAERCLALNPSHAGAYRMLAIEHFFLAEPERTLAYVEPGTRLNPRDPQLSTFLLFKGWALLQQGEPRAAASWLRQAQAISPQAPNIALALSVALTMAGDDAAGRQQMTYYLSLARTQARTVAQWSQRPPANAGFASFAARVDNALLRAGMPP